LVLSSLIKGRILENEKGQNFFKKLVKISRFKVRISLNIASFYHISPKETLKYTFFLNIKKWPNGNHANGNGQG